MKMKIKIERNYQNIETKSNRKQATHTNQEFIDTSGPNFYETKTTQET